MQFWINFFGILGLITTFFILQQNDNKKLLRWKLVTDVLWIIHYLFLGATSVAAVTLVAVLRSCILLCQDHAWARSKVWLWIFLASSFLLSVIAWQDLTSLLPMIASLACIVVYWIGKPNLTRIVSIPACVMFLIKVGLDGSVWGVIDESIFIISALIGMLRHDRKGKTQDA